MNPRAAKRRARYAFTAGALFFSWASPALGLAASAWLTTTDVDFSPGTKVDGTYISTSGVQSRGTGAAAYLELYRDWTTLSPSNPPPARSTQGVWDTQNNRFFVFGGATASGVRSNETRVLAPGTTAWTNLALSSAPSARERVGLAYSTSRSKVYAFSGEDSGYRRELWTYDTLVDSNTWVQQPNGATSPSKRSSAGTAYDEVGDRLIIFGGDDSTPLSDTWAWSGSSWTDLAPSTFPAARLGAAMTYAGNGKIVLFGGDSSGTLKNDTWIFVSTIAAGGAMWTSQRAAPAGLSARKRAHLAYDSDLNRVILFGGQGAADTFGGVLNDLWYYDVDGDSWAKVDVPSLPIARSEAAVAYSPSQKKLYVFGGADNISPPTFFGDTSSYALTASPNASATWTAQLPYISGVTGIKWGNLSWTPAKWSSQPFQNPEPVKFRIYGDNVTTFDPAKLVGPTGPGDYYFEASSGVTSVNIQKSGLTDGWDGLPKLFLRAYFTGASTATPRLDSVTITYNRPPTVPTLSGPADGSIEPSPTPAFTWAASTDADNDALRYRISIATESGFTTPLAVSSDGITGTAFTPTSNLNEGRYYWRVEATDDPGGSFSPSRPSATSGWSAVRTVNVLPGLTVDSQTSDTILVGTVTVNWTLSRATTGHTFAVLMNDADMFNFPFSAVVATGLPNGTTTFAWDTRTVRNSNYSPGRYALRVKAIGPYGNVTGDSSNFAVVNSTPLASRPDAFVVTSPPPPSVSWSGPKPVTWTFPYLQGTNAENWSFRAQITTVSQNAPDSDWKDILMRDDGYTLSASPEDPQRYLSGTVSKSWVTSQYLDASVTQNNKTTWLRVFMDDGGTPPRKSTVTAPGTITLVNNDPPEQPNDFSLRRPVRAGLAGGTVVELAWQQQGTLRTFPGEWLAYTLYYSTRPDFAGKTTPDDIAASSDTVSVSIGSGVVAAIPVGGEVKTTLTLQDKTSYYWKVVATESQGFRKVSGEKDWWFQVNTGGGVTANIARDTEIILLSGPGPSPGFERRSATFTAETAGLPSALAAKQKTVKQANDTLRSTPFTKMASAVAYEIGVFDADWQPDQAFKPGGFQARISVKYPSTDGKVVDGTQIPVEKLRLVRLNESTGEWSLVENSSGPAGGTVNAESRVVVSTVTRFSTFALLAYASPSGVLDGLKSYPNPFAAGRDSCTMAYMLTKDSRITLKVYSGAGDLVWQKNVEPPDPAATAQPVSPRKIVWDGRNEDGRLVANGGYLLRLTATPVDGSAEETMTWKLAVLK